MNLTNKLQNFVKLGKDKYMFKIPKTQQKDNHKRFWEIFLSVLPEDSYFTDNNTTITFPATKVQTLHNFKKSRKNVLSYRECYSFFKSIGRQFMSLEKKNLTVPFFTMKDFIVIDDKYIVFMNANKLYHIKNGNIIITTPFEKERYRFFSPELKTITSLPAEIYFTSSLFSLAKLTIFLLTNKIEISKELIEKGRCWNQMEGGLDCENNQGGIGVCSEILLLESIFYSKLYWAIERCLYKNPKKRYFLII